MSIVSCPKCGNKISSLAKICLHCGHLRTEADDDESLVFRQRQVRDRIYHLKMTSYAVMAVFLAAFSWYWWESDGFIRHSSSGPWILMGLSAFGYLIVRALLYQAQRKQRQLKRRVGPGS
jgi:hypothetical protein